MYTCPYCNKSNFSSSSKKKGSFLSWLDVRHHASKCALNTHDYVFSAIYGPINYKSLTGKNFKQIRAEYPDLEQTLKTHITKYLRKSGHTTSLIWTLDSATQAVKEFVQANNRIPTSRDTYNNFELPSDHWAKKYYKSWNNFITLCGFTPSKVSGYGNCFDYIDGNTYRSALELYFVTTFLYQQLDYEYEKYYPGDTNRISDFYLPKYDLFIEIAGGLRPEVIKEKIKFSIDNNLRLLVLYPRDIYKKSFNLLDKINIAGMMYR